MKSITIIILGIVLGISTCFSQGFKPPQEGKAVIYFARTSDAGFAVTFNLFHGENYIGKITASKYVRYECDPGENLFWAAAENKSFLKTNLKAGETYLVKVKVKMGAVIASTELKPVTTESNDFKSVIGLVKRKKPFVTSEKVLAKKKAGYEKRNYIKESIEYYETNLKSSKKVNDISEEMFIPRDAITPKKKVIKKVDEKSSTGFLVF